MVQSEAYTQWMTTRESRLRISITHLHQPHHNFILYFIVSILKLINKKIKPKFKLIYHMILFLSQKKYQYNSSFSKILVPTLANREQRKVIKKKVFFGLNYGIPDFRSIISFGIRSQTLDISDLMNNFQSQRRSNPRHKEINHFVLSLDYHPLVKKI